MVLRCNFGTGFVPPEMTQGYDLFGMFPINRACLTQRPAKPFRFAGRFVFPVAGGLNLFRGETNGFLPGGGKRPA